MTLASLRLALHTNTSHMSRGAHCSSTTQRQRRSLPPTCVASQPGISKASTGRSGGGGSSPARRKAASPTPGSAGTATTPSKDSSNGGGGGSPPVAPVPGGVSGSSIYCVCHSSDEGFMVECSDGTGGCGGWFHPECCNLELSPEQRQKSEREPERVFVVSASLRAKRVRLGWHGGLVLPPCAACSRASFLVHLLLRVCKSSGGTGILSILPSCAACGRASFLCAYCASTNPLLRQVAGVR